MEQNARRRSSTSETSLIRTSDISTRNLPYTKPNNAADGLFDSAQSKTPPGKRPGSLELCPGLPCLSIGLAPTFRQYQALGTWHIDSPRGIDCFDVAIPIRRFFAENRSTCGQTTSTATSHMRQQMIPRVCECFSFATLKRSASSKRNER